MQVCGLWKFKKYPGNILIRIGSNAIPIDSYR